MSDKVPKHKCGYRLCTNSVWGMKPRRKYCQPDHALKEKYLRDHPQAKANQPKPVVKMGQPTPVRSCKFPGCKTSLVGSSRKNYCELKEHSAARHRTVVKRENKIKKQRYYERHGIKFDKTVRKRQTVPHQQTIDNGMALVYDTQMLIYENYKEPLKPIEKTKGVGYYGTLAATEDKMYVQCHICGHLFANLGLHVRAHKVNREKYKDMFQLQVGTALISEKLRETRIKNSIHSPRKGAGLPEWLQEYNANVKKGVIKHNGNIKKTTGKSRGAWSLEKRNKEGMCPDQVLEKIKDLAEILGKTPSVTEFQEHYKYRFVGSIQFQHGSWQAAVKKCGLKTRNELRTPDKEALLQDLIDFRDKYDRIPVTSDFNRGLLRDRGVYIRTFGTLNNARMEAGLNAVIPMPFGQIVELTPEQYLRYKAGLPVDEKFKESHQGERKRKSKYRTRARTA